MKLLLDEHLSRKLVPALEPVFPGTSHVLTVGLSNTDDDEIWIAARERGFMIISKDDDFQIKSFTRGHPPKVIWLRSGNGPTDEVLAMILRFRQVIEEFEKDDSRSLLVIP